MFLELLIFGTFWFWLFLAVEVVWLVYCAAREVTAWQSLLSVLLFLGVLQCLSNVNVLLYLWENPITILLMLGVYLFGGCIWVFPKWWLFCTDHLRRYVDLREKFLSIMKLDTANIPDSAKDEWREYYARNNSYHEDRVVFKPSPKNYKNRIITWMTLWPLSFLWTMLNDPIVRFFRHIYYEIAGVLQKISDNVFKNVAKDFEKEEMKNA